MVDWGGMNVYQKHVLLNVGRLQSVKAVFGQSMCNRDFVVYWEGGNPGKKNIIGESKYFCGREK